MNLIIVSGRSGSGKSITLNVLEDIGYYCIDSLPLTLLPDLIKKLSEKHPNIAVSIDARNLSVELDELDSALQSLKKVCELHQIIFLDAQSPVLITRFGETRRRHPLTNKMTSLKEALKAEKVLLQPIADYADFRIDTTHLNVHQLRQLIRERLNHSSSAISILVQSFGYKNGVPADTDYTFDVRCLPNPYWEKNLRPQTGLEDGVINFLTSYPEVKVMFNMIKHFINKWLPYFERENRKYLTISIGCTGGQHRSVFLAEKLGRYFEKHIKNVVIRHRDLK